MAVIRNGEIVTLEEVGALRKKAGQHVIVEFGNVVAEQELERIPGVSALTKTNGIYHFNVSGSMDLLIKVLGQHEVIRLTSQEAPLGRGILESFMKSRKRLLRWHNVPWLTKEI